MRDGGGAPKVAGEGAATGVVRSDSIGGGDRGGSASLMLPVAPQRTPMPSANGAAAGAGRSSLVAPSPQRSSLSGLSVSFSGVLGAAAAAPAANATTAALQAARPPARGAMAVHVLGADPSPMHFGMAVTSAGCTAAVGGAAVGGAGAGAGAAHGGGLTRSDTVREGRLVLRAPVPRGSGPVDGADGGGGGTRGELRRAKTVGAAQPQRSVLVT